MSKIIELLMNVSSRVFSMSIFAIVVLLFAFSLSLLLFENDSAHGLSCAPADMASSFENADVVFSGKAVSKEYLPSDDHTLVSVTLFSVIDPFKGVYQDTVKISSDERLWGANFTEGSEYVVFAHQERDGTWHQLCTPTSLVKHADIDLIRKVSVDYVLPPLKQSNLQISPDKIQCKGLLELVARYDGIPACVKPETVQKLQERGWVMIMQTQIEPMIFQGKPLDYWKKLDFETLREYNRQTTDDKFYYDLGEVIAREFFENKLAKEGIMPNTDDSLKLYTGITLTPDPPIIGYNTVVNATDGFTHILHTSVQGNKAGEYFSMERLVFEPHILRAIAEGNSEPSFVNKFGATPTIYIVTENGEDLLYPHQAIIDFEQTDSVMFVNDSDKPVRVQEVGENKISDIPEDSWHTGTIMPGDSITVHFNSTGYYEFSVKKTEGSRDGYLDHHEFGEIVVFTEGMTGHAFEDSLLMGRVFVTDVPRVEMPWESIGAGNSQGLRIGIVESVKQAIPNAEEYYLAKAKSLIPFEVNVIIE
ncbi:hypothetical protein [Nitrosopumilus sp.]|uniref:hypothetical protein n=1 Tax=Nitrosopumilus sp. TaxID=2024843 RepID=UPI003B5A829E